MTDKQKDPQEWTSGDDPMTEAQRAYLETLSRQTGQAVPDNMSKAAASEKIDELRAAAEISDEPPEGAGSEVVVDVDQSRAEPPDA